jgi:hypothetical protein
MRKYGPLAIVCVLAVLIMVGLVVAACAPPESIKSAPVPAEASGSVSMSYLGYELRKFGLYRVVDRDACYICYRDYDARGVGIWCSKIPDCTPRLP